LLHQVDGNDGNQRDGDGKGENTFSECELLFGWRPMIVFTLLIPLKYRIVDALISTNLEVGVNCVRGNEKDGGDARQVEDSISNINN
jgi:hypothetical protein